MTTYTVPVTMAKEFLEFEDYVVATDEGEAVAMACGEYLATGIPAKVVLGENGLLNALDAILTLSQLHQIPIDLHIFMRKDEPQHRIVSIKLKQLLDLYQIKATIHDKP